MAFPRLASLAALAAVFAFANFVRADEEEANRVHVVADTEGTHYLKSIPAAFIGSKGETRVYRVTKDNDVLEHTFDWYAGQIYLQGTAKGVSVVRLGPWARGHQADKDQLAIAFYLDGKLLKEYSTLDIAGKPDNVKATMSHYTVLGKIFGYRWVEAKDSNDYVFDVEGNDGKTLSFDLFTGKRIEASAK